MFPGRANAKVVRAETPKKSDRRRKIYRARIRGTGVKEESQSETIERGTRRVRPPRVFLLSLLVPRLCALFVLQPFDQHTSERVLGVTPLHPVEIITLDFPFLTSLSPPSFGSPFPAIFSRTVSLGGLNTVTSSPGTRRTTERSIDIFGSSCPNQGPGSRQTSLLNPDLSTRLCLSHDFLFLLSFFSRSLFCLLSTFGILAQNRFSPLRERITEEHLAQCLAAS